MNDAPTTAKVSLHMFGPLTTFPPRQDPRDWVTQYWNILLGQRVDAAKDDWLLGPSGAIGENAAQFVARLARERGLRVERNGPGVGLVEGLEDWGVPVRPGVAEFYRRTSEYGFAVRTEWRPGFGHLGFLVASLFSRRVQQLNLPMAGDDRAVEFHAEIIRLVDAGGRPEMTIWHRSRRETGEIVFFGLYGSGRLPSGDPCVKVIFPLPQGSATVIFRPETDAAGNLRLVAAGRRDGDPGFYFLVEDGRGGRWKHYLPSLRQSLGLREEGDGSLRAEHTLGLWGMDVFRMTYAITRKTTAPAEGMAESSGAR